MSETNANETTLLGGTPTETPAAANEAPAAGDAAQAQTQDNAEGDAGNPAGAAVEAEAGAKPAEGAENGENGDADGDDADAGVPETYQLKAPDGFESLDDKAVELFTPVAKELGLTNKAAQRLVDDVFAPVLTRALTEQAEGAAKEQADNLVKIHGEWKTQASKDAEIGGADHAKKLGTALLALDAYATPALREFLNESPFGSHPEVVRLLYRVGKTLEEDGGLVRGAPAKSGRKTDAEVFFPELTPQQG